MEFVLCFPSCAKPFVSLFQLQRWSLDNEAITTAVYSGTCHFVDDGKVDKGAIIAHYRTKKKTQMPSFVSPNSVKVPEKKDAAAAICRVGRTERNVRVSNVVIPQTPPQTRVRASAIEGKRVLVTGGEHRGLSGTITSW